MRTVALAMTALLFPACRGTTDTGPPATPTGPVVVIPPGVTSIRTADQVAAMMLAEIATNEQKLGRVLAPPRILRIQLLRAGEMYPIRHFDGTNPEGYAVGPSDGPGWVVEAVGTFLYFDWRNGNVLTEMGIHGVHEWDDAGGEAVGMNPCWLRVPSPQVNLDGVCR